MTFSSRTVTVRRPRMSRVAERLERRVLPVSKRWTEEVGLSSPKMLTAMLQALVATFGSALKTRRDLALENLTLHHQGAGRMRSGRRVHFRPRDRLLLFVAVLIPNVLTAQVYSLPTSPPAVTAAGATWQFNGEPVPFAGSLYYPTGPTVFFNGFVMVRIGIYKGVPIYTDATLEPNSVIYVPIGTNLMRPHERRRAGQLVGTVGSRAPSFPIERDVEVSARGSLESPAAAVEGRRERPTATTGSAVLADSRALTAATNRARTGSTTMRSIPPPRTNAGIWIEFNGARWRRAGAAVAFSAARFAPAGGYHGFPVYRDKTGQSDHIYIPAVSGGPLVPYSTR